MAWTITNRFPFWGRDGAKPTETSPATNSYSDGDQIVDEHINYLWSSLNEFRANISSVLRTIDSDADGVVDEADNTTLVRGEDADTDGDGVLNAAQNITQTYKEIDLDNDYIRGANNIRVPDGDIEAVTMTTLADGATLTISEATFLEGVNGDTAPSETALNLVSFEAGDVGPVTTTLLTTVLDGGDSNQRHLNSNVTYTNGSGGTLQVAVVMDNGVHETGTGSGDELLGCVGMYVN